MTSPIATSPFRALLWNLLAGLLLVGVGSALVGCDQGGANDDGDNFIAPSTSRVSFEVRPGAADTTQQLTLTYTDLTSRPRPADVPTPFVIEMVEETGSPSDGSSVFNVTFSPPQDVSSFTEKVLFEAGDRVVTIQLFGAVGFEDELITDYAGSGIVDEIIAFNGVGTSNVEGQLSISGMDVGGAGVFAGTAHVLSETVDFSETPVLVARMKVSADSDGPAIVRAALNQVGDPPDANSSAPPLIKEVPADGEYTDYYFDFRDLFVQFDGQPVDATNIGEVVFLVNDGGALEALGRTDTFTGTILVDRVARRPDIPGEGPGGGNSAPSASFTVEPSAPAVGETVTFTDQSSDDGMITSRDWDFGDGTTATGAAPTHTYNSAGDFSVTLTVTDDEGATATSTQTVTVTEDSGGGGSAFRGDDDGDGQIIFDDFEDELQEGEYFTFQGGGAAIGLAESSDVPMGSSGSTAIASTIDGGSGGGFAGFGKGVGSDIEVQGIDVADLGSDPYFTMYVKSDATTPYTLEINLQEDQDGNGQFDGSGAVDDEFQYNYAVDPSTSGYTRISVPLSAFVDDNAVNDGGDGELSSRIANVVFAIGGLPAETFTLTIDDILYSDTDLGSGAGANDTACGGPDYEMFFEDNFDGPNESFWDAGTATFNGNRATFRPDNISYENGKMVFTLKEEQFNGKPYTGAELRTDNQDGFYTYGCYEVRMKSAGPSGTVSSFFAYRYNPWQEIDIEVVGKNNYSTLTNIYFNEGPAGEANNDPFQVPPFPQGIGQSYDASEEFHNYAFEWTPGEIKWYRDGKLVKQATVAGAQSNQIPDLQMQIMMNLWVSSASSFAGEIDDSNFPVQSEYDWVRFYRPVN
jgi:beta-glucanase (GH16 family)